MMLRSLVHLLLNPICFSGLCPRSVGNLPANETGQFNHSHGIAVNSSGFVYVADVLNDRIQVFTS